MNPFEELDDEIGFYVGGFWENFIHERNRWFVWTSGIMAGISVATIALYFATGAERAAEPRAATDEGASGALS